MAGASETDEPQQAPLLRVIKGDATPEEVAAIVAVVASMQAPAAAPPRRRSAWADPARGLRRPLAPGPAGWRTSGLPR